MAAAVAPDVHRAVLEAAALDRDRGTRSVAARTTPDEGRVERRVAFVVSVAAFLVVGHLAAVVGAGLPGDALSRVTQAQAAVVSRDPHLEAIGFVWGPFPTMFQVPLVAARAWWAPLTSAGMAAVVVGALFMGGVVQQLLAWGAECGTRRWMRIAVVVLVVAHPLVWTHGVNGMSEACWLFFVVVAMRHLARWSADDDTRSLVIVGVATAAAYLTRYESAAVAVAVLLFVATVSARRSALGPARSPQWRRQQIVADVLVVAFPVVAAMVVWAAASWLTVGEPFPQFSSAYGNAALVERGAAGTIELIGDASAPGRVQFFLRQVVVAAPFLVVSVPLAFCVGRRLLRPG